MQSARTPLSPNKENQLPSFRGSPTKNQQCQLAEIVSYLKENGIKLPPHLLFKKNTQDFSLKLKPIGGSTKQLTEAKSLRIRLCDTEFELKKMEQDIAQYKRAVRAEKDKEQRKYEETLERLRQDSRQNNEDYEFSLEKQSRQNSEKIEKLRAEYGHKLQRLEKQLILKHSAEVSKIQHKSGSEKESQEVQFNKKYSGLHKQLTEEIQTLRKQFEREKHDINQRNRQKLQQQQKKYDSTLLALQSEKKTEEKLQQKTRQETKMEKEKMFAELCYERNARKSLEDEVTAKNKEIKNLKQKIQELKIQLEISKENAEKQKQWISAQHEKELQSVHEQYKAKTVSLLQTHTEACEKYESRIEKLNHLHGESQKLNQSKLVELSLKFQQRMSKPEDLEEIKKLTDTLLRKDEELKKLNRDLKYRNLEIQNKEEVYNKIFKTTARVREEKKGLVNCNLNRYEYPMPKLERDSWSKESLLRKSQSVDVKVLLRSISKAKKEIPFDKDQ